MARSTQQILLLLAIVTCYLTRSQAAPLDTKHTRRNAQDNSRVPTQVQDMYACWNTKSSEKCAESMLGDRSSRNSTIPEADTVEMFISTAQEDPVPRITLGGQAIQHVIEFKFNVSSMSGTIHKTEVRVFHSAVKNQASLNGCDSTNELSLYTVNSNNEARKIDSVNVHTNHDGWVIFDSVTYQPNMHRMAIASSCSSVELTDLGFKIDDDDKLPMLVVFTSQELLMTETRLLPAILVDELSKENAAESSHGLQKRNSVRCHLQSHTVTFRNIGLEKIIQPDQLKINLCVGSCAHPVAHNDKNNMYATIRASASKADNTVGDPCCVPISYQKATLMYKSNNKLYTIYASDAIATECGCR